MNNPVRWRFVVVGVALGFAALFLIAETYNRLFKLPVGGDFAVFWRTAQAPLESIYFYNPAERPFVYPPSSLPLMELLGLPPLWLAYPLFMGLCLAAFYLAGRRLYSRNAMLMALVCPAMAWTVAEGQMSALLAALMFLAFSSPPIVKGALIALVLSIKPQFAFLAPLVLWDDRKAMTSMVVAGLALLVFSIVIGGFGTWADWFRAVDGFGEIAKERNLDALGVSLPAAANEYGFPLIPAFALAFALSCYLILTRPIDDLAVLIVGCSLFASPHALPYDLVALAPWAAERLLKDRIDWRVAPNISLYLHMFFPVAWLLALAPRVEREWASAPSSKFSRP